MFLNNVKPQILCVVHIWEACKNNQQIYSKCVRHTAFIKGMFVINFLQANCGTIL